MNAFLDGGTHYYGDTVRRLFLTAGIIIIITLPFFSALIPFPVVISSFGVLIIGFVAGMTSPRQSWVTILNVLVSVAGLVMFEYYAVAAYMLPQNQETSMFFWTNELLAVLFFFTLYYSGKTLRGHVLNR